MVALDYGQTQLIGLAFVISIRLLGAGRHFQALDHPATHFCCRLVGEGQRHDFFGFIHPGQQSQEALREQLGFTGAGRRLDDEGVFGVECLFPVRGILLRRLFLAVGAW